MNRSIRSTLNRLEVRPSRAMGQNFLTDAGLADWLVEALEIGPDETVVEIGSGTGVVTRRLIGHGRRLIAIEKDRRLASHLREEFVGVGTVEVIEADAAAIDPRRFFRHGSVKVLGNLPYSAGTSILMHWVENPSPVGMAVFMLQKEVCDRIVAAPRTKDYGQLSVRIQARWNAAILRAVPPSAFHPQPRVESAVIALRPRDRAELPVFDESLFAGLVRDGFAQRRKQLKNRLRAAGVPWEAVAAAVGIPVTARAEELTLRQWIDLTRVYDDHPLGDRAQSPDELFDVVDEENQVIDRMTRAAVHLSGRRHRAAHVFVFNRRGELLLQKRSHLKDTCPGKWDSSCAGHLDAGEDYATCARRELREELGIDPRAASPRRVACIDACAGTGWEFVELYVLEHDGPVRLPAAEIEAVMPLPLDEVRTWAGARPEDFAPGFLRCLAALPAECDQPRVGFDRGVGDPTPAPGSRSNPADVEPESPVC